MNFLYYKKTFKFRIRNTCCQMSIMIHGRFPCGPGRHLHALPLLLAPAQHVRDHQVPRGYWGGHLPLRQLPPRHHCQEKQIIVRHSPARAR